MTTRFASLLAAAALSAAAAPALAQDRYHHTPPLPALDGQSDAGTWEGEWEGAWEDEETYRGAWYGTYTDVDGETVEAEYHGTFIGEAQFLADDGPALYRDSDRGWREERAHPRRRGSDRRGPPRARGARFGYSAEEREEWLDRCRSSYWDGDGREQGAAIGAALGALGGGLAGNRIAGRGDRLEGTLLGAGAGAVAGAAVGSAIGAQSDREGQREFCEDYLDRYEDSAAAYGWAGAGASPYGTAPMMWVRVPILRERRDCGCEEVVEEWIEEEVAPPARARRPAPRPDKRVRYTK